MSILGFGVNDKNIGNHRDATRYKGKKNQTDMISLCWLFKDDDGNYRMGEDATPKFKQAEIHYIPTKGYVLDNEYLSAKLGAPKRRIATFIVKYATDANGNVQKPFNYEVMEWQISPDKYSQLAAIHSEYPLTVHDLKVTCTDDQYQKMTFIATRNKALWQQNEDIKKAILEEVEQLALRLHLGRDLPIDDLKDHFGESVSAVAPAHSVDVNFDDFLNSI